MAGFSYLTRHGRPPVRAEIAKFRLAGSEPCLISNQEAEGLRLLGILGVPYPPRVAR